MRAELGVFNRTTCARRSGRYINFSSLPAEDHAEALDDEGCSFLDRIERNELENAVPRAFMAEDVLEASETAARLPAAS